MHLGGVGSPARERSVVERRLYLALSLDFIREIPPFAARIPHFVMPNSFRPAGWRLLGAGLWGMILVLAPSDSRAHSLPQDTLGPGTAEAIAEVRVDDDGDHVPDRLADTVTVAGRVTAARGRLTVPVPDLAALQDSTGGIHVRLPEGPSLQRGDSVRVRGVVEQAYGLTQIQGQAYRRIETPARRPAPIPLTVAAAGEPYEGQLAQIRARIVATGSNEGGDFLYLADPGKESTSELAVFVGNRHKARISLDRFDEGDEVEVTGVVGQHDFEPPYTEYYQIEPRGSDDLARRTTAAPYLWTALYVLAGGGLLAVGAIVLLRSAVRRRTQELADSRARFRRLAEATTEGIALHDADGTLLDANAALADMVGIDRADLIGRNIADVLPDGERNAGEPGTNGREEASSETVLVRENGQTTPIAIEERTVEGTEDVVHVCAVRDITQRKEWEAEILRAKEEAEQMSKLKSNLLSNMSHELRTPVTNITGYAELLMEETDGSHRTFATHIYESGKRLSETLQSVLDMAQIEAGTIDVLAQDVRVEEVVQEVLNWHAQKIDDAIALEVDVPSTCTLRTDRTLLYRILNNLIQNAIKFTKEGTIEIEATSLESGLRIVVRDTGVGIAPEFRPDLFEPFKQESEGWAREFEGTGLGLTLTKRMVELLDGSIEVESTKDEGSVFTVVVPELSRTASAREETAESAGAA